MNEEADDPISFVQLVPKQDGGTTEVCCHDHDVDVPPAIIVVFLESIRGKFASSCWHRTQENGYGIIEISAEQGSVFPMIDKKK